MNQKLTHIIYIIALILVNRISVNAQNESEIPTFGIKAGILFSTINGDDAIDQFAKRIGPQIGITGAYYFNPHFSARAELNYELKGGKFDNHELTMDLHYATLPLYLKFSFTSDPEIYVYGGGYASYLIAAKTKGTYEIIIGEDHIKDNINEDISNNLTDIDAGAIVGIGAQGRYNRWFDIFIDFRYSQGFINLNNNTADKRYNFNHTEFWPEQDVDKPKNKAFMFTTGLIFYLDPR